MQLKRIFSPSTAIAGTALFLAAGGVAVAQPYGGGWATHGSAKEVQLIHHVARHLTVGNAMRLDGRPGWAYADAKSVASSGGVKFLEAGQTVRLGKVGHFTFSASCSKVDGQNQATFDVVADTTAALDGNAPAPARTPVNIHTNRDALDMQDPGAFDQVGSASDSTELAADGQEVDVFYNDGVNWPAMGGSAAHDCFAGFTGFMG
jgi:hypothetical protein